MDTPLQTGFTTYGHTFRIYGMITNDVSDYINLLVRIAHIICNHPLYRTHGKSEGEDV
jgi:hypothetical protein